MRLIRLLFMFGMAAAAWPGSKAGAQVLHLAARATEDMEIKAELGDTLDIEVRADLGRYAAAGLVFFVQFPVEPFDIIARGGLDENGVRPFVIGPLFDEAIEVANCVLPYSSSSVLPEGLRLMHFAAIMGPGDSRSKTGSGVVATFSVRCTQVTPATRIGLYSSPINETGMVLADGRTERPLYRDVDLEIAVSLSTAVEPTPWGQIKAATKAP